MAPRWIGMGLIMGLEEKLPSGFVLTTVEKLAGYMRKNSLWPATFGLACCAIEMMAVGSAAKYDISRFGMEVFRASPRQADLMIVAGRVSNKMAPVLRQIYDQMAAPKWVLAMGACASSGGMFNNYAIVQGVDHVVPVDIYLPGCPPCTADGDGSIPHSYASNFALLYRFGPVSAPAATEISAKPKPMAPITKIGTYGLDAEVMMAKS